MNLSNYIQMISEQAVTQTKTPEPAKNPVTTTDKPGARQQHGLTYEKYINKKFKYTPYKAIDKFDSEAKRLQKFWFFFSKLGSTRVSIKICKKGGSIGLGDFIRISEINEPFIMHVGFWSGTKNNIVEEYGIKITPSNWKKYIGDPKVIHQMKEDMKSINNTKAHDAKWKQFTKEYKEKYMNPKQSTFSTVMNTLLNKKIEPPAIKIAPKRNHVEPGQLGSDGKPKVKQKRIQASITYNDFINKVVADNKAGLFYLKKNGKVLINKKI